MLQIHACVYIHILTVNILVLTPMGAVSTLGHALLHVYYLPMCLYVARELCTGIHV